MRLEHHLVGGYVRYISPHIIIIIKLSFQSSLKNVCVSMMISCITLSEAWPVDTPCLP